MIIPSFGNIWGLSFPNLIRINTVNIVGVMSKGIALEFKKRYPLMFQAYKEKCKSNLLAPGILDIWKTPTEHIINFPTKIHWKDNSRYVYIQAGLVALRDYLKPLGQVPVALPALGCSNGGLDWELVSRLIATHLVDLDAEIYVFGPPGVKNVET